MFINRKREINDNLLRERYNSFIIINCPINHEIFIIKIIVIITSKREHVLLNIKRKLIR